MECGTFQECISPCVQQQNYLPLCTSVLCEAPGVIYVSIDPDVWKIRCQQCTEKTVHRCALKKLKARFKSDTRKRWIPPDFFKRGSKGSQGSKGGTDPKAKVPAVDPNLKANDDNDAGKTAGKDDLKDGQKSKADDDLTAAAAADGTKDDKKDLTKDNDGNKDGNVVGDTQFNAAGLDDSANSTRLYSLTLMPPVALPDNYCICADRPKEVPPQPNVCLCDIYKPLNFMFELEVTGEFKPAHVPRYKKEKNH